MTRGIPGTTPDHGDTARYVAGCRCDPCRAADARRRRLTRYDAALGRPRMQPATGTHRRLQALAAIGWSFPALAVRLGVDRTAVAQLLRRRRVLTATARRVQAVYDELSMTPGPSGITRTRALAKGWAPPLAWDDDTIDDPKAKPVRLTQRERRELAGVDDVAVQRVVAGDRLQLTKDERIAVVEQLAAKGMNDSQIAERVGVTDRTVHRDRMDRGIESKWVA